MAKEKLEEFADELANAVKPLRNETLASTIERVLGKSEEGVLFPVLLRLVTTKAVKRFVSLLSSKNFESTCREFDLEVDKRSESAPKLVDIITESGVDGTLFKFDLHLLRALCKNLGLGEQEDEIEKPSLEADLLDEIMLGGMEALLNRLPPELLDEWRKDFELAQEEKDHQGIVDAILVHMFQLEPLESFQKQLEKEKMNAKKEKQPKQSKKGKKRKREESPDESGSKKRTKYQCPPLTNIKKGITREELHNLYNQTDLQEYCKEQEMLHTGKKSVIIKRILNFLETGNKETASAKKGKKKKGKPVA